MTTLVALSLFTGRVRAQVPRAPTKAISDYLLDAAIEFCERSRYWREDLTPMDAVAGQASYTAIPPTAEAVIEDIVSVRHNTVVLDPSSQAALDSEYSDWRSDSSGQADYWFATARDNITLVPYPSESGTANIEINAALKPARAATSLPQQLYDNYVVEIAAGALARLMAMSDVPWSAADRVAYHQNVFDDGIRRASLAAVRGFNRAPIRTRRPPL